MRIQTYDSNLVYDPLVSYKPGKLVVHENNMYRSVKQTTPGSINNVTEWVSIGNSFKDVHNEHNNESYELYIYDGVLHSRNTNTSSNMVIPLIQEFIITKLAEFVQYKADEEAAGRPTPSIDDFSKDTTDLVNDLNSLKHKEWTSLEPGIFNGINSNELQAIFTNGVATWDLSGILTVESLFVGFDKNIFLPVTLNLPSCVNFNNLYKGCTVTKPFRVSGSNSTQITTVSTFENATVNIVPEVLSYQLDETIDVTNMFNGATFIGPGSFDWDFPNVTKADGFLNITNDITTNLSLSDVSFINEEPLNFTSTTAVSVVKPLWGRSNKAINRTQLDDIIDQYKQGIAGFENKLMFANVSQIKNFSKLNLGSTFNLNLSNWDVSSGENFSETFKGCGSYNQPLSTWDMSNALSLRGMFEDAFMFNRDISNWNTSNVIDMSFMFKNANTFNQPINTNITNNYWVTTSVKTMKSMFQGASKFNQDISDWDTSNVENMDDMFNGAIDFNGGL